MKPEVLKKWAADESARHDEQWLREVRAIVTSKEYMNGARPGSAPIWTKAVDAELARRCPIWEAFEVSS
jgi:hypothetical protein